MHSLCLRALAVSLPLFLLLLDPLASPQPVCPACLSARLTCLPGLPVCHLTAAFACPIFVCPATVSYPCPPPSLLAAVPRLLPWASPLRLSHLATWLQPHLSAISFLMDFWTFVDVLGLIEYSSIYYSVCGYYPVSVMRLFGYATDYFTFSTVVLPWFSTSSCPIFLGLFC